MPSWKFSVAFTQRAICTSTAIGEKQTASNNSFLRSEDMYPSNKTFPSHPCAPQIKNHNSSLIVATAHRTHKPSLLTRKKKCTTRNQPRSSETELLHTRALSPFPWQISARTKETHKDCECSRAQTLVSDCHQALFAEKETKNSNNPFSSLHFSRAVSHDMPSSAAVLQIATVTKTQPRGQNLLHGKTR